MKRAHVLPIYCKKFINWEGWQGRRQDTCNLFFKGFNVVVELQNSSIKFNHIAKFNIKILNYILY